MSIDVYTKKDYSPDCQDFDFCYGLPINSEVKQLYYLYRQRCNPYLSGIGIQSYQRQLSDPEESRSYYVYAWYVVGNERKYFYVGKGRHTRYRHILSEIKSFEDGKSDNPRFEQYSVLGKLGIDCEFLIKGLTEYEAIIFEQCTKLRLIDRGDVLLCVEGIDTPNLPDGWCRPEYPGMPPTIQNSPFRRRYLNDTDIPQFDQVSQSGLKAVWFYPYFLVDTPVTLMNRFVISKIIGEKFGGKVLKARPAKNRTIIVQGYLFEETYRKLRERNCLVYSDLDIISFFDSLGFLHERIKNDSGELLKVFDEVEQLACNQILACADELRPSQD